MIDAWIQLIAMPLEREMSKILLNTRAVFALAALPCFAALSSCATDRTIGSAPEIELTKLEALPEPRNEIFYTIGPQEVLEIEVVGAENLSGEFLTNENGEIGFPLLGIIDLSEKSPSDAADLIADGLRGRYIIEPQVRVIPSEFPSPSISVGGQVRKPGSYSAIGRPTLLRVVNQAEGLAEYAKLDDVLVMRTVAGQKYIGVYNLGAIQRGNYDDPLLYPNDIVMVGDSPGARRLDNILQFAPILSSAVILLDRVGR
ncbi:polysaccharide biosynthesis/export family protein [Erythrobacter sp. YT30]|uniref:polysaccharide biosynthesis/export family protein n=1 Tax=Erythrobacter sp. YT30 TaxID=1735012 RepID=UPI00076C20C1|nr:polysaccharide biosynthesis/export family protein [Erythrobacter sp. YT30]KWV91361.1 hypothetical protein AUC45_08805 [Erythrobacter sp. YT30]